MMGLMLSENDKLIILSIAGALVLLTFILTVCLVSPWCYLYKWIARGQQRKKCREIISYPPLTNGPESQHFHLSIVPVYGTKNPSPFSPPPSFDDEPVAADAAGGYPKPFGASNNHQQQFEHLTSLAEKTRLRYSSVKSLRQQQSEKIDNNNNIKLIFPKIEALIYYKCVSETTIRLCLSIRRIYDLGMKDSGFGEPSPYVTVLLSGYRVNRKSIIAKAAQNQIFRTETVKRCLDATFPVESEFVSEELPRYLIKEASIKLRLMDEERYANDVCLGELSVPLRKIRSLDDCRQECTILLENVNENDENKENSNKELSGFKTNVYTMFPIKEIKGELLAGFCYLPTSRRVNLTIVKGSVRNCFLQQMNIGTSSNQHQAFYIKALMFINGKLVKKKKTSLSIKLCWGNDETISFDLPEDSEHNISFMVILSHKIQNSTSPETPDSPGEENATIKDCLSNCNPHNNNHHHHHHHHHHSNQQSPKHDSDIRNNSNTRKESCIGHFTMDNQSWIKEILNKPRKQTLKWYKLY